MRSGPGEARTILLLHIIRARPSKQPLMVRTFLKVYMELGSFFFVSARTNKRHHHLLFCCFLGLFLERFLVELEEQVERLSLMSERCRVLIPKETYYSVKRYLNIHRTSSFRA